MPNQTRSDHTTLRGQAETRISQAEEQWERTFNAIPDLIMILDNEHRIIRANKSMVDKLGTTTEALVGRSCYQAVHGTEKPPDF